MKAAPRSEGVGEEDAHLGVDGVTCRPGVLSCDATGLLAFFEKPRLVDDQDAARVIPEVRGQIVPQIVTHSVGIPASDAQEALHPLRIGIADRLSQLPPVLAFDAAEQADEIAPESLAHFGAGKPAGDALIQIGEDV
jgi:hypothetical protein